ncbi:MAG: ATP-binding cassette domain-containing protein, partial [Tumebacillaceae bacterium]
VLITCVVFFPLTIITWVAHKASKRIDKYRRNSRVKTGSMTGFIGETIGAIQSIQVAGAESSVMRRFQEINEERQEAMIKESVFSAMLNSVFLNIVDVGTGVILLLSATSMQHGMFTVGEFAAFVYYLTWISQLTRRFGMLTAKYKQVGVSFGRMKALLQGDSEAKIVEHGPDYLKADLPEVPFVNKTQEHQLDELRATNLTYVYPETKRGVRGVDLLLKRGSFTVVTGRVGSGKTTLLRSVLGLLPLQAGVVYWNGQQVEDLSTFMTPPRCAYTPQVPQLFSDTLRQNVLLGLPEEQVDLDAALRMAVMDQDLDQLAAGKETFVGTRGVMLSGGQRQRTAAARMFVRTPELYVMDDLSSALDVETEQTLWASLFERHGDATCLVASHRPAVLRRADRILVLQDGEVVGDGTLEELLESCAEMQKLWAGKF